MAATRTADGRAFRRRARWLLAALVLLLLAQRPAPVLARAYLPPGSHLFAGLTGGTSLDPYEQMVGKHPAVFEVYMTWNTPTAWLAAPDPQFRARLALHISTSPGYGMGGVITPAAIAAGRSDRFLVALGENLARSRRIVYVRLMGEMDAYWNAYAAYSASGAPRGPDNSPQAFVQAWRRTVLILRGGRVSRINARLRSLGMGPLRATPTVERGRAARTDRSATARSAARLASPRVAFLWVPQDAGSPEIAANSPRAFWPGSGYVDWVGTDFYASYPNFSLLDAFYTAFPGKPFVLSEWALYGADEPAFVHELFAWARSHPRLRMLNYYQGFTAHATPSLSRYPHARLALRSELRSPAFLAYPPEYSHPLVPPRPRRPPRPPPEKPPLPPQGGAPPGPPPAPGPPGGPCLPLLGLCLP